MRTSLGLASQGLLDRGGAAALHIASLGHLRTLGIVEPPTGGGGAIGGGSRFFRRGSRDERRRIQEALRRVTARTRKQAEAGETIDVAALEAAIAEAQARALADLPEREPSGRRQRAPLVEIPPERFIEPVMEPDDDYALRLLLLLGV